EGEEDDQRDRQRDERGRRDHVDVRSERAQLREDRDRQRPRLAAEDERDEQVVPRPEELEDRERGDRRQPEGEDQAQEDPELGGAVDARRLEDVLGYPDEEVPQEEDRERQPEGSVEEDQPEHVSVQMCAVVQLEDGDQGHLQRDDQEGDDKEEEPVPAG